MATNSVSSATIRETSVSAHGDIQALENLIFETAFQTMIQTLPTKGSSIKDPNIQQLVDGQGVSLSQVAYVLGAQDSPGFTEVDVQRVISRLDKALTRRFGDKHLMLQTVSLLEFGMALAGVKLASLTKKCSNEKDQPACMDVGAEKLGKRDKESVVFGAGDSYCRSMNDTSYDKNTRAHFKDKCISRRNERINDVFEHGERALGGNKDTKTNDLLNTAREPYTRGAQILKPKK